MRAFALALVLGTLACSAPEGRFACVDADDCPGGWVCRTDQRCWSTPAASVDASEIDAQADLDASVDPSDADMLDAASLGDAGLRDAGLRDASLRDASMADAGMRDGGACSPPRYPVGSPTGTGATRCSQFGGLFIQGDTGGLPCRTPNPFTGACTCPSGFMQRDTTSWRTDDGAGGLDTTARLWVCEPPSPSRDAFWGGLFVLNSDTSTCAYPNRIGATGFGCECASGYGGAGSWDGSNAAGERVLLSFCTSSASDAMATFSTAFTHRRTGASCTAQCIAGPAPCECEPDTTPFLFPGRESNACENDSTLCVPTF